jgi:hypothetical protein
MDNAVAVGADQSQIKQPSSAFLWLLTYKQGVEAFRVTDRLSDSDRATLMGETLSRVYNWSPSKA